MDRFLHASVRLNTDLGRATRFFSHPDQMARWLCSRMEPTADGNGMNLVGILNADDHWLWMIDEIRREQMIRGRCLDFLQPNSDQTFGLEIQLMKCTSLTEYCSEIHVIQRGFAPSEEGDNLRAQYLELWKTKLETLRTVVNGSWIIEDKDLTLDLFK